MFECLPWATTRHKWFEKLRTDLRIVSSSFQIACSIVSGPLCSAVSVLAPGTSPTWLPTRGSRGSSSLDCLAARSPCQWSLDSACQLLYTTDCLYFVLSFSYEIRSWKLCCHQFRIHQVNTAWTNVSVQSFVLKKWATFGAKISTNFWDITIFMLGNFLLTHPVYNAKKTIYMIKTSKNSYTEIWHSYLLTYIIKAISFKSQRWRTEDHNGLFEFILWPVSHHLWHTFSDQCTRCLVTLFFPPQKWSARDTGNLSMNFWLSGAHHSSIRVWYDKTGCKT